MAIKVYLEEAVKRLQVERDRAVAMVNERVTREQIVPFNIEIDKARDSAISQRNEELNAKIKELQEAFALERQSFIDSAEKKKAEHAQAVKETETAIVVAEYDKHIKRLTEQLSEVSE